MFGWVKDGATSLVKTTKKIIGTEQISKNNNYIIETGKILLNQESKSRVIKGGNKEQSFDDFLKSNHISRDQLHNINKNNVISFYIFLVGFIFCVVSMVLSFFVHDNSFDVITQFLPSLSIGILCFVLSLKCAYVCYQIRQEKIVEFKSFLTKGINIFPSINMNNWKDKIK